MTKKDEFINYVNALINNQKEPIEMSENVRFYWEAFCSVKEKDKPIFTDNGKLIMKYLQGLPEGTPPMKAKDIAEEMFISSRTVSGAIRKLVNDEFVEKIGQDPVMYVLTETGRNIVID